MTQKERSFFQKKQLRKYRQPSKDLITGYEASFSNSRQSFRNKGWL